MSVEVTTDRERLDVDLIHRFLSEESYWAKGIPRATLERAIANSLCFGAFEHGEQVGFARVVTDRATFGYLADVFVVPAHRGRGVSRSIMEAVRSHPDLQGLRRWHLSTLDAHAVYEKFGFTPLAFPERHMEILQKNPYAR